ncbi:MAG: hypothetical protein ACJ0DI_02090 [bacterium]
MYPGHLQPCCHSATHRAESQNPFASVVDSATTGMKALRSE